jgi:hypothetical protein
MFGAVHDDGEVEGKENFGLRKKKARSSKVIK